MNSAIYISLTLNKRQPFKAIFSHLYNKEMDVYFLGLLKVLDELIHFRFPGFMSHFLTSQAGKLSWSSKFSEKRIPLARGPASQGLTFFLYPQIFETSNHQALPLARNPSLPSPAAILKALMASQQGEPEQGSCRELS